MNILIVFQILFPIFPHFDQIQIILFFSPLIRILNYMTEAGVLNHEVNQLGAVGNEWNNPVGEIFILSDIFVTNELFFVTSYVL